MASGKYDEKRQPSHELLGIIATNVKTLRLEKKFTQLTFGEKCEFHPTFISLVERRQRNITISTLEVFARALGVEPYELLKKPSKQK